MDDKFNMALFENYGWIKISKHHVIHEMAHALAYKHRLDNAWNKYNGHNPEFVSLNMQLQNKYGDTTPEDWERADRIMGGLQA